MTSPHLTSTARGKNHTSEHWPNKSTAVVTLIICCIAMFGQAEAADTWSPTGSMITGRYRHTATLLSDLRHVLVTGGHNGGPSLSSAEIYDPLTNTWSPVASMNFSRALHTATLLLDGRVLVVGGDSAEIYDPVKGTWTSTGATNFEYGRAAHTATLLLDGRVLVTGGENGEYFHFYLEFVDIYDPVMNTWAPADAMEYGRQGHKATRLPGGQVLVTGASGRAVA